MKYFALPLLLLLACGGDSQSTDAGTDATVRPDAGDSATPRDSGSDAAADSGIPPVVLPTCNIASCNDGLARTCTGDLATDCSQFNGMCSAQTDTESGTMFQWCNCGNVESGAGRCISERQAVVCAFGIGSIQECGPGMECAENPERPYGISCECNNLDDNICPGSCAADPDCETCTPNCSGRTCGSNGCGGSCGSCELNQRCTSRFVCEAVCTPDCTGKVCGDNGCGGSCGSCGTGQRCTAGQQCEAICVPNCDGKTCGDNGCGGSCGTCGSGTTCAEARGMCVATCTPNCDGRMCGDNGCGGNCGTCADGSSCNDAGNCVAACTPNCTNKTCGEDGCGGSCGTCGVAEVCTTAQACAPQCVPNCSGLMCGDDGCGGSCGSCAAPLLCGQTAAGSCACPTSAVNRYQFDARALTFNAGPPPGGVRAGDVLGVTIRYTQAAASPADQEQTGTVNINTRSRIRALSVPGCTAVTSMHITYIVATASGGSFRCEATQSFTGTTSFVVQAPTNDLAAGSCVATGLMAAP